MNDAKSARVGPLRCGFRTLCRTYVSCVGELLTSKLTYRLIDRVRGENQYADGMLSLRVFPAEQFLSIQFLPPVQLLILVFYFACTVTSCYIQPETVLLTFLYRKL